MQLDQWSIQSAGRSQPAHLVALDDAAGTELYINGRTGEIFQQAERRERVLIWFGAIPHWLYPTALRRSAALWSQVVIWTVVAGTFQTLAGLHVGISRWRRPRNGESVSPFRGWWYWHHITGLVLWLLTLAWVFSGLLTMNPRGAAPLAQHELRDAGRDARGMRWLEGGLHQLDIAGMQHRPLWDCIVLLLLAGVTVSCVTGSWMALQRVRRDLDRAGSGLTSAAGSSQDPER